MGNSKNSILVAHNKKADYRFLLPNVTSFDVSSMIWRAVDAEGNILVSNMGRLSLHLAAQALKNKDAVLLGGTSLKEHIHHNVERVYFLDRPERSLTFEVRDVLWNDQTPYLMEEYKGSFFNYKIHLHREAGAAQSGARK